QSTADNTEDPSARRGLQDIMDGSGSVFSKNADHTKIMLHLGQAVDLQTHGDAESAADELKGAISAGLDAPAAFYSLGMLQVKTKRLGSAKRNLQKVMSHPSFSLGARLLLGDIWYQRTKYKNAAMRYLEALRAADAQVVSQEQADELRELYDPLIETLSREKDENLQKQLCDNISNLLVRPNWRQRLSNARQQLDDHGDIPIPLAEMLVGASSSDVVVAMSTVRDLARDGHLGSALEEILFALQQSPTYLPLHILLGDILMSRGNLDEAAQKFNVVARAYSIRGEAHRAIVVLRRIIELDPMNLDIRIRLIDHLTASGKIDDANKEYLLLAGIYYSLAELKKARQAYSQALQLSKQSKNADSWRVRIFHRIADIDMQSLNWRQAIKLYKQIRVLRPGDVDACRSLINLYSSLGESGQVLEVMDAFIAHANEIGEPEQAIEFLQSVIAEQPDKAMIHYRLAAQCQQTHRTSEAIQHYDNASELLLDAGDKAGAKELIQKIIKLNPSNKEEYEKALESL
ncbi:MAG: hypothetical protein U9Q82_06745, partial [Chloroflexota bacterium]|nr:hypothetical protein [Chloroflexota bacterium]